MEILKMAREIGRQFNIESFLIHLILEVQCYFSFNTVLIQHVLSNFIKFLITQEKIEWIIYSHYDV